MKTKTTIKLLALLTAQCSVSVSTAITWNCGYCGEDDDCTPTSNVIATLNTQDSTLTISGTGDMKNYDFMDGMRPPWYNHLINMEAKRVVVANGVTSIGAYAFYSNLHSDRITSLSIASSVLRINDMAFRYACKLDTLVIPQGVIYVAGYSFSNCKIKNIVIPASLTEGEYYSSMDEYYVIGAYTFWEINNLENVYCAAVVPYSIHEYAFPVNHSGVKLHVPPGSEAAYRAANVWNGFNIVTGVHGVVAADESLTMSVGQVRTLAAQVLPTNAYNRNVTWHSSNAAVAYTSGNAVFATGVGTAMLVVSAGERYLGNMVKDTVRVTVTSASGGANCDAFITRLAIAEYRVDSMRTKLVAANNQLALFQDSINNLRIRVNAALYQNTLLEMNNSQITSRYNAARVTIGIVRDSVRTLQGQLATCSTNDGSSRVSGGSTTTVQSQTLKLMVHPNPAGSMLYITDEYAGIVEIYDLQGTLWLTSTRNDINISTLPAGIYVVKAGEKSAKVVKQ